MRATIAQSQKQFHPHYRPNGGISLSLMIPAWPLKVAILPSERLPRGAQTWSVAENLYRDIRAPGRNLCHIHGARAAIGLIIRGEPLEKCERYARTLLTFVRTAWKAHHVANVEDSPIERHQREQKEGADVDAAQMAYLADPTPANAQRLLQEIHEYETALEAIKRDAMDTLMNAEKGR